ADGAGSGTFWLQSGSLSTGINPLAITARALTLSGALNSGAAGTTLTATGGSGMDLAMANTGALFQLDGTELARIFAGSLSLNGGGPVTVNGMDRDTHLANIAGGLTISGSPVAFSGASSTFKGLTVNGASTLAGVNLTGNGQNLTFNGGLTLTTGGGQINTGGGNLAFTGTVDGAQALTLNAGAGTVTLDGNLGAAAALGGLTVTGNTFFKASTLNTTGALTFNNGLTLGNSAALQTSGGVMNFQAVDATAAGVQTLTLNSGGGQVMFNTAIGESTALGGLTVTGPAALGGNVTTQGGAITFNNALTLNQTATLATGGGNLNLNAVDGAQALTLNAGAGTVNLDGSLGQTTRLTSLAVTGAAALSGISIFTNNGNLAFNNPVTLDTGAVTLDTNTAAGDITLAGTVDGGQALTLNAGAGTVTLGADLGAADALESLTVQGAATVNATSIKARDGVTFNGNVTALSGLTLNADTGKSGAGTFVQQAGALSTGASAITLTANDVQLTGSINTGAFTLAQSRGGSLALGNATGALTLDGAELGNLTATSFTAGDGAGSVLVDGVNLSLLPVTLRGNAAQGVTFQNNNSSFKSLTVEGPARLQNGVDLAATNGGLTFQNAVTLDSGAVQLTTAGGGALTFQSTLDGAADLVLNSSGGLTFGGNVGASTALNSLQLTATSGAAFSGSSLAANNGITLKSNVTGAGALSLNADADGAGGGVFTLDSGTTLATGSNALTLAGSDAVLNGLINSGAGATTFNVTGAGSAGLGNGAGTFRLTGTELQNITAGGLTINAGAGALIVDGVASSDLTGAGVLTLTGGSTTFSGTASAFNGLTVNGRSTVAGVNVSTTLGQGMTFNGNFTLTTGDVQLATAGGALNFNGTVDGGRSLTLNPGAGTVTFGGNVGAQTALTALTLNGTGMMNGAAMTLNDGLTLNGGFTTSGAFQLNTDANADGVGNFNLDSGTLNTGGNAWSLTANDFLLGGSGFVNTGAGIFQMLLSDNGTLGLGAAACGGSCGLSISGDELGRITTAALNVGSTQTGAVTVDGVTAVQSANIGAVSLLSGGTATFNNASTFRNLNVRADDVAINGALSTGAGTLALAVSDGGSIGVGAALGDMTIDAVELGRLTANTLNIGDAQSGDLILGDVAIDASRITQKFGAFSGGGLTIQNRLLSPGETTLSAGGAGQGLVLNQAGNLFGGRLNLFTGSGGDVLLSGMTNGGQTLRLGAATLGGSFTLNSPVAVEFQGAVLAQGAVSVAASQGGITFQDGASLSAGTGTLQLTTPGLLTLGRLVSQSTSASALQITAGSIVDGGDAGGADLAAANGGLVVKATGGFGSLANPLETEVASLNLINSQGGEVGIFETDGLTVLNLNQGGPGGVFISFFGSFSGKDNIEMVSGRPVIIDRATGFPFSQVLGNTGKDRDQLALERTVGFLNDIESISGQNRFVWAAPDASPAGVLQGSGTQGRSYVANLFAEAFSLVEVEPGREGGPELVRLESIWPGQDESKAAAEKVRATQKKIEKPRNRRGKPGSGPRRKKREPGFFSFLKDVGLIFSYQ
ncbi:MAG: beta strand repeat-containing protein, partial [Nitrospinaceae bacterium]